MKSKYWKFVGKKFYSDFLFFYDDSAPEDWKNSEYAGKYQIMDVYKSKMGKARFVIVRLPDCGVLCVSSKILCEVMKWKD